MSWPVASFSVLAVVILAGFFWYERTRPPARVVAMVAALAALAVVGRLAFAPIPNVKPTTDIVLFAGFALGPIPGFMVGAITALVSNLFFGQGPWTAWQMVGWGGVGVAGALVAHLWRGREPSRIALAAVCGLAGLAFGAFMDVYQWSFTYSNDPGSYLVVASTSLPYNLAHAIGNVAFCLLIGPAFIRALRRYRRRFDVRWAVPAVALLLLVVAPSAAMASTSSKATNYLLRAQNRDGGFGNARGASSNGLMTGWAALGLGAARKNPAYVKRRRGRTVTRYLARTAGRLRDLGEIERTILVLKAAGRSPRRFGGRNLVAELVAARRGDGSFAGQVSYTAFGILALKAAGKRVGRQLGRLARPGAELRRRLRPVLDRGQRGRPDRSRAPGAGRHRARAAATRPATPSPTCAGRRTPTAASASSAAGPRTRSRPPTPCRGWSPSTPAATWSTAPSATSRRASAATGRSPTRRARPRRRCG